MFSEGKAQTIQEVLLFRTEKQQIQESLSSENPDKSVISLSLNVPGPIKNNPDLRQLLAELREAVEILLETEDWAITAQKSLQQESGLGHFYVISVAPLELKEKLISLEQNFALGRLADLDVYYWAAGQLQTVSRTALGYSERSCLLCQEKAKNCGRSRAHSVQELQDKIEKIYQNYMKNKLPSSAEIIRKIPEMAQQALLFEVVCLDKPGLVDPYDVGSHPDMDIFTFLSSASALYPYFQTITRLAIEQKEVTYPKLFQAVRQAGIQAENAMFDQTAGVNTHKGAIFSLGLFLPVCAPIVAIQGRISIAELRRGIQQFAQPILGDFTEIAKKESQTWGEKNFKEQGELGIRGEALAGYPAIFFHIYPFFHQRQGAMQDRLLDTLLFSLYFIQDTTLVKRSQDPQIHDKVRPKIDQFFALGGARTEAGRAYAIQLNRLFVTNNWTLGGCADTLILVVFLELLYKAGWLEIEKKEKHANA